MSPAAVVDRLDMSMLPLWPTEAPEAEPVAPAAPPVEDSAGVTLADVVERSWSALEAGFTSACLLCGGVVHPRWSAGAGVVGGRCSSCGADLE